MSRHLPLRRRGGLGFPAAPATVSRFVGRSALCAVLQDSVSESVVLCGITNAKLATKVWLLSKASLTQVAFVMQKSSVSSGYLTVPSPASQGCADGACFVPTEPPVCPCQRAEKRERMMNGIRTVRPKICPHDRSTKRASVAKRLRRFGHRMSDQDASLMRTVWQGHTGGEGGRKSVQISIISNKAK